MKSFLIGSLPHKNIEDAISYIDHFSIPTLCTLPQLDETEFMLHHAFNNLPSFEYLRNRVRKKDHISKILPFEFVLEEAFFKKNLNEYKWQCTGPVTMIETMDMHEHEHILLDEYYEKLRLTQYKFNDKTNGNCYFFLDEPLFGNDEHSISILSKFLKRLKVSEEFTGVNFGIHCCSKCSIDLNILDFDLFALDYELYSKEEWVFIQKSLVSKLVACIGDSNLNSFDYQTYHEVYASTSCGLALTDLDTVEANIKKIRL